MHFAGSNEQLAALLGGHIDAGVISAVGMQEHFSSGRVQLLGVFDREENKLFPCAVPFPKQGYNVTMLISRGFVMPGGTPKEIVQVVADFMKRCTENKEWRDKMAETGQGTMYMGTAEYEALWDEMDKAVGPVLKEAKAEQK